MSIVRTFTLYIVLLLCANACSQQSFPEYTQFGNCHDQRETTSVLKDCKGKIFKVNDDIWTLVPDDAPDARYGVCEMPAALKTDQLKVIFSGQVKKIMPYERLAATPMVVTKLKVVK